MSDPLDGLISHPSLSSEPDQSNIDNTSTSNIPISDFRRNEARPILTDDDRHKSIYHQTSLTKHNPSERRRKRRHRSQPSGEPIESTSKSITNDESFEIDNPSARIQFLLGDEDQDDDDEEHKPHDLFIELNELIYEGDKTHDLSESIDQGWKETARWVKFEEDVESGGRWSKPHVATLSLHSLLELRNYILNGSVLLDLHAEHLPMIIDMVLDDMMENKSLSTEKRVVTRNSLLLKHIHQHEKEFHRHLHTQEIRKPLPFTRSLAELTRNRSQKDVTLAGVEQVSSAANLGVANANQTPTHKPVHDPTAADKFLSVGNSGGGDQSKSEESGTNLTGAESRAKINLAFMKKIPPNSEATNVLIGAVEFLQSPVCAFVRLSKGVIIPDLLEVAIPTRFLFILIGPASEHLRYHEIGRSIGTLMCDEIFRDIAYRARNRQDLLAGIDDFLDHVTVLPPGEWDPKTRIEPPKSIPNKEERLDRSKINGITQMTEMEHEEHQLDPSLIRTGRFCGGLIGDLKRKLPFFWSDITDAISFQSIAAIIFLYFACLSPIITFGGLLSKATDNNMAAIESLLSGAICGCLYHLFAGQPLTILGSTGPVLVFETIVNVFCTSHGYDYMNFRCWIGLWTASILLIMVVTDASYLVKYITRFTEESFAALIGIIFVYEAFDKMIDINRVRPVRIHTVETLPSNCSCRISNRSSPMTISACYQNGSYEFVGSQCGVVNNKTYIPDVFLFSLILFLSTFVLAYTLKNFKFSRFLPMTIRSKISDFGVVLAIFINVYFDYRVGLDTPKLKVPQNFATTKENRGWIINPFGRNPVHMWFAALLPALLATILIFMDQQITAVIVNRKENKLKKGCGYHLDLLIVAVCIAINSVLGLPWFVAATVLSINHVIALKLESETAAPGEKAKFLGVREQRVTGFIVFLFIGLSVFLTKFLGLIPMPVLYGVFLYMGISSMKEIQLISRILLIFMPEKYQPDYVYLRHVRTRRVHMFTFIQLSCLALLWIIKSIKQISILFPIMVLALVGARKVMDYIFTQRELEYLDDVVPEVVKKEIEERRNSALPENIINPDKAKETITFGSGEIRISVGDGKVMKVPTENVQINPSTGVINFSEEVGKTFLWKSIAKTKDKVEGTLEKKSSNTEKSRASGIKNRIRKLSLSLLGPDEDRALVSLNNTQLPAIVIEQPEPSLTENDSESRRTSLNKDANDGKM